MKITATCFFVLLCCIYASSQTFNKNYTDLIEQGNHYYREKEYKKAAETFSAAVNSMKQEAPLNDIERVAFSFALANEPDSAFRYLEMIVNSNRFKSDVATGILDDPDYKSLYTDKRWTILKEKMYSHIYQSYKIDLQKKVQTTGKSKYSDAVMANKLAHNDDSTFAHLNDYAFTLLKNKKYKEAYKYIKVSLNHFYDNYWLNRSMGDYYQKVGDKERAYAYYARALNLKYQQPETILNSSIKLDSAIVAEYRQYQPLYAKAIPPDYLLFNASNVLLQQGMLEKAYNVIQLNLQHHPESHFTYRSLADYYAKMGDKKKSNEHLVKSLILQHNLPEKFFDSSYNAIGFINSRYENISKQRSGKVVPPEALITTLANQFSEQKIHHTAEAFYKLNIKNYPQVPRVYNMISAFYKSIGDTVQEVEYRKLAQSVLKNSEGQSPFRNEITPDTTFNVSIEKPICQQNCPVVLIDEAHNNYHTASNRYKPFANLIANDGFKVVKGKTPFTEQLLAKIDVVVIAAPGYINKSELSILNKWIRNGGSLFTITDHNNFGFDDLLESIGVGTPETEFTEDTANARILEDGMTKNPRHIVFSEKAGLLGNHPIMKGRNKEENIKVVKTFAGRTIIAPNNSTVLLKVSESAVDYLTVSLQFRTTQASIPVKMEGRKAYGAAYSLGKGKVVVVSEAAMLTAQIWLDGTPGAGMNCRS